LTAVFLFFLELLCRIFYGGRPTKNRDFLSLAATKNKDKTYCQAIKISEKYKNRKTKNDQLLIK